MAEDREKLILDIEVIKENASKDLKEFQKELDKTAKKEERLAKIEHKIRQVSGSNKNANAPKKAYNSQILKELKSLKQQEKLKIDLPTNVSQKKYKSPILDIKRQEQTKGRVLSYDPQKHTLQTEQILRNNKRIVRSYKDVTKEGKKFQGVLSSEKHLTKSKTSSGGDGLGRIKRIFQSIIAFRLASAGINLFLNSFRQGIEALKQSGSELSKPFEKFNQATMAIKVSLGTIIIPLVQTLTSLLDPLSNKMIDLANAIAFYNAQAQGQTEYYKLSKEKIDEYTKSLQEANKQLTQLDKFATLSGKKSFALGEVVNIDPNTKEGQANIKIAEKLNKAYTVFVTTLNTIKDVLDVIIALFTKLGSKGGLAFLGIASAVGAISNPMLGIIAMFGSFMVLMSDASIGAKMLAGTIMVLAGAFTALAIAKAFGISKTNGLLVASAIGGAIGVSTAMLGGMIGDLNKKNISLTDTLGITKRGSSSYSSAMASTPSISSGANDIAHIQVEVGDINLDGKKVADILTPTIFYNGKKQNLI